jgi:hypothetical protein
VTTDGNLHLDSSNGGKSILLNYYANGGGTTSTNTINSYGNWSHLKGNFTQSEGTFKLGTAPMSIPLGNAPMYTLRAWARFNGIGTTASRTLIASGNIASITRDDIGRYTVTFTTAMPDANYALLTGQEDNSQNGALVQFYYTGSKTTTSFQLVNVTSAVSYYDNNPNICFAIVR